MFGKRRRAITMSMGTIFRLRPFEPKRLLVLPCKGGEITLYVLEGRAYVTNPGGRQIIRAIHFDGWSPSFDNAKLDVPADRLVKSDDAEYCVLDVVFRLVPLEGRGQTAEIVAVSYDGCETFYENELCTLVQEYEEA